tara:strand:- start:1690 stop:2859 length:1170 start_codon:yes stop_codon:yes gene_type:complete
MKGVTMRPSQLKFVKEASARYGVGAVMSRGMIDTLADEIGMQKPNWLKQKEYRVGHGMFKLPEVLGLEPQPQPSATVAMAQTAEVIPFNPNAQTEFDSTSLIPERDALYVKFGQYADIAKIIKSGLFYPCYITGLSGNGKTFMVEQSCAESKREMIRVNLTAETDEDDLMGGFRLINGETKYAKGPVIKAMERGAVLLLDEIDLANPAKIMCLQSVLEGKPYFVKKTGELVKPKQGFQIIATANTKGKGSDDGRFIGTNVMNEAFLERFPITVEQEYPSVTIEKRILKGVFADLGVTDIEFSEKLVDWADIIRKTYYDGAIDELISTRRLVHISKAFAIFDDRMKSIDMCINRFDEETKSAFRELYTKIDEGVDEVEESTEEKVGDVPF